MKLIPSSPIVFVLVLLAIFGAGMLFGKLFGKKTKAEKFNEAYHGIPMTVVEQATGPKVLPPVPTQKGVLTHDLVCDAFNC
jgi:hypothetical protein